MATLEGELTPKPPRDLDIRLHLAVLSLSNTINKIAKFGVIQSLKAVHGWVQKAQIATNESSVPDQVALDEIAVKIDGKISRPYRAADPEMIETLITWLDPTRTTALTEQFLHECQSE